MEKVNCFDLLSQGGKERNFERIWPISSKGKIFFIKGSLFQKVFKFVYLNNISKHLFSRNLTESFIV